MINLSQILRRSKNLNLSQVSVVAVAVAVVESVVLSVVAVLPLTQCVKGGGFFGSLIFEFLI